MKHLHRILLLVLCTAIFILGFYEGKKKGNQQAIAYVRTFNNAKGISINPLYHKPIIIESNIVNTK